MKFLEALTEHRFHVLGVGVSYANIIGFIGAILLMDVLF